jgi:pimeloyl-ACP methyl ester carboxylesterase
MIYYKKYINENSKDWVTFIHGAGGSSAIWNKQIDNFKDLFNVILLDLRGHGKSSESHENEKKYTFKSITNDVLNVLDKENIIKTHLVGISLGSIIARNFIFLNPERCKSAVLGGMVVRVNNISKFLLFVSNLLKALLPAMFLYRVLAKIILPKRNQKDSKKKYIQEAKKISQIEFLKWFETTKEIKSIFKKFKLETKIPIQIIQGAEDLIFLKDIITHTKLKSNIRLKIIENCGHVVNIQSPVVFNKTAIEFISSHSS